jgi:hypothetical protein
VIRRGSQGKEGHRLRSLVVRRQEAPPLFVGYLLVHALIVAWIRPGEFPDTESYLHLSLTGADSRLPTVPLLYAVFPSDPARMWAQVLLAAAAWWILASVASRLVTDRRVRVGLRVVLLMIGVAEPVANWNSLMLSESTSLSLTALVVAAWIRYWQEPRWRTAALVALSTLFWTFARQPHVLLTCIIAVLAIAASVRTSNLRPPRVTRTLAAALLAIGIAGLGEIHRNQTISTRAVGAIIQERILLNPTYTRWFVAHGMPYTPLVQKAHGMPFGHVPEDPLFIRWLDAHGISTYVRFVLENPHYALESPLPFFPGEEASLTLRNRSVFAALEPNPTPSLLSPVVNYGRHHAVLPSPVDRLLFDQGAIGDVLLLGLLATALTWIGWRRHGWDRRLTVPAIVAVSAIPQGYLVWLSGGEAVGELDRLAIVTAVSLRIGLWIILALAIDRLLGGQIEAIGGEPSRARDLGLREDRARARSSK